MAIDCLHSFISCKNEWGHGKAVNTLPNAWCGGHEIASANYTTGRGRSAKRDVIMNFYVRTLELCVVCAALRLGNVPLELLHS